MLVARQRAMGAHGDIVMEGRDIGTTVFPNADVKIFLDADPAERARRRASDPAHTAQDAPVASIASAMEARDHQDRTRAASPLASAPDAVIIDTTHMTVDAGGGGSAVRGARQSQGAGRASGERPRDGVAARPTR